MKYNEKDYIKIVKFIKNNLKEEEEKDRVCKEYFKCPCCNYTRSLYNWENYSFHNTWDFGIRSHIEGQIRLNGNAKHIKLLINILGKRRALEILEVFANRNILIGLALKSYMNKLKTELYVVCNR